MESRGSVTRFAIDLKDANPAVRDEAARQIWERYSAQLLALIRNRLDRRIRVREHEEDIVLSMYESFVAAQSRHGEAVCSRDELWRILVRMSLWKLANAVDRHTAARRDVRLEIPHQDGEADFPGWMLERMESGPGPEEVASFNEQIERGMNALPEDLRCLVFLKMEGCNNKEIADKIGRTTRTVELKLHQIRSIFSDSAGSIGR